MIDLPRFADVARLAELELERWPALEQQARAEGPVAVVASVSAPAARVVDVEGMTPERMAAEAVVAHLQASEKYPSEPERKLLKELNTWRAIRKCDRDALKKVANWTDRKREYRVDSLGKRIAGAWAHYIAGEEPRVTPANDVDAGAMAELLEVNHFASELERAMRLCSSEGQVWARLYVDELVAPRALLEWISRRKVRPYFVGTRLAGAAIETELALPPGAAKGAVYRHFEVHAPGIVLNVLFAGTVETLGTRLELVEHPATMFLEEQWHTGLADMLVDVIFNYVDDDVTTGESDYAGILDDLLDLNEAKVIGAYNMRLTARKRAIVSSSVLRPRPRNDLDLTPEEAAGGSASADVPRAKFDSSEEVFVEDPLDRELGKATEAPFRILEYSFDATALIEWKRDLVESAVSRAGLNVQYVGVGVGPEGYAISGTALRLRFIPTDKTGRGKGRYVDDKIPSLLSRLAQLDALGPGFGGLGRQWADPVTPPTFVRRPGIPRDDVEEATRHNALMSAGIESVYTAVKDLHPEWTEDDVNDEVDRIRADKSASAGSLPLGP